MSEIRRHPLNAKGKYYVDYDVCLNHCCFDIAPKNFKFDENYISFVFKQPETPEEETKCKKAMLCCPVGAIFDDGE